MNLFAYKYGELYFILMPLCHSESKNDTELNVYELKKLNEAMKADKSITWDFDPHIEKAQQHCNIIAKFGRFPTRNAVLGRENTQTE